MNVICDDARYHLNTNSNSINFPYCKLKFTPKKKLSIREPTYFRINPSRTSENKYQSSKSDQQKSSDDA